MYNEQFVNTWISNPPPQSQDGPRRIAVSSWEKRGKHMETSNIPWMVFGLRFSLADLGMTRYDTRKNTSFKITCFLRSLSLLKV